MQATELYQQLIQTFPEFHSYWQEDEFENEFSPDGIMMAFTGFYLHYHDAYEQAELAALAQLIEDIVIADPQGIDPLTNATANFLQNIFSYSGGQRLSEHLGAISKPFYKF